MLSQAERQETAFEALEEVLIEAGRIRRPGQNEKGFRAVAHAICLWRGQDSWGDLTTAEQLASLETHSSWRRQKRVDGDRSALIMDEHFRTWKAEIAEHMPPLYKNRRGGRQDQRKYSWSRPLYFRIQILKRRCAFRFMVTSLLSQHRSHKKKNPCFK